MIYYTIKYDITTYVKLFDIDTRIISKIIRRTV